MVEALDKGAVQNDDDDGRLDKGAVQREPAASTVDAGGPAFFLERRRR